MKENSVVHTGKTSSGERVSPIAFQLERAHDILTNPRVRTIALRYEGMFEVLDIIYTYCPDLNVVDSREKTHTNKYSGEVRRRDRKSLSEHPRKIIDNDVYELMTQGYSLVIE